MLIRAYNKQCIFFNTLMKHVAWADSLNKNGSDDKSFLLHLIVSDVEEHVVRLPETVPLSGESILVQSTISANGYMESVLLTYEA